MELQNTFSDSMTVRYVIDKMRGQSPTLVNDVIVAYNLFFETHPELTDEVNAQLERVYLLCKYLDPEAEDVISMLLYRDCLANKVTLRTFFHRFSEMRYERYFTQTAEAYKNAPERIGKSREACIEYYIMLRVCEKMFNSLMKRLNKNRVANTYMLNNAYALAKEAHMWAVRKSGVPYLAHPLRVADILANLGMESEVLAAALLHDVVEDTAYTLEDISKRCGVRIARYVDAVTSVHKEYTVSHQPSEYRCDKAELDANSFKKLVCTVSDNPEMIFALYIEAADRMHNLRTIEPLSDRVIHEQMDETQLDYLPLFRTFKMHYFVREIENLMWRAADIARYTKMEARYGELVSRSRRAIDGFKKLLSEYTAQSVNSYAQVLGSAGYDVEIYERTLLPYEVYEIVRQTGSPSEDPSGQIVKKTVPVCDFDIVPDPRDDMASLDTFISGFMKMFEAKIAASGRTVIRFAPAPNNAFVFEVMDSYRNIFRCRIILQNDYAVEHGGVRIVDADAVMDESFTEKTERINVQLRNGQRLALPKGATVIDVAFAIHEEVGYTVRSAIVNGKKVSIYHILVDGDRIVVEADTYRKDGVTKQFIPHVRISWLNSVSTKRARKKIIGFLADKYEGDDPRNESEAQTAVVDMVSDRILETLRATT